MLSSWTCIVEPPLPRVLAAKTMLSAPWMIPPGIETPKFREMKPYQVPSTTLRRKTKRPEIGPRLDNSRAVTKASSSSEPRWREKEPSLEDRRASVESVLSSGSLLSALDGVRFQLEASDFNTIPRRFGELKQSQEVGLVKEPMKTTSIIMRKPCPQLIRWPTLRAFDGLGRCALNTSSRRQVLVRCAANDQEVYSVSSAVSIRRTGLPMVVYIPVPIDINTFSPDKNTFSDPCIKVSQYYGDNMRLGEWFSMTIGVNPRVIGDTGYIRIWDLVYASKFIQQNRSTLMSYQMSHCGTLDMLKRLEKIDI